ncbi:MAG: hypothetical protein NXI04_01110 [Planctomycetaceae bacterium]|nr:hypothetical protein [Planctomycetaceae bacterium]
MSATTPQHASDPAVEDSSAQPDRRHATSDTANDATLAVSTMAVSLCFWCTLLAAAMIYGTVALAPKLAVWQTVRAEYQQNVRQLVALEEDVEYLERVDKALQTDPEFLQRMTGNRQQDDHAEFIPVSGSLLFGQADSEAEAAAGTPAPDGQLPSDGLLLTATRRVATDGPLRNGLLVLSASLTIFAFAFLNDAGAGFVTATGRVCRRLITIPVARYTRAQPLETTAAGKPAQPSPDASSPEAPVESSGRA